MPGELDHGFVQQRRDDAAVDDALESLVLAPGVKDALDRAAAASAVKTTRRPAGLSVPQT